MSTTVDTTMDTMPTPTPTPTPLQRYRDYLEHRDMQDFIRICADYLAYKWHVHLRNAQYDDAPAGTVFHVTVEHPELPKRLWGRSYGKTRMAALSGATRQVITHLGQRTQDHPHR